jgi:hypothetical protein
MPPSFAFLLKALSGTPALPFTLSCFASMRGSEHLQFSPSLIADSIQRKTPSGEPEGVFIEFLA